MSEIIPSLYNTPHTLPLTTVLYGNCFHLSLLAVYWSMVALVWGFRSIRPAEGQAIRHTA